MAIDMNNDLRTNRRIDNPDVRMNKRFEEIEDRRRSARMRIALAEDGYLTPPRDQRASAALAARATTRSSPKRAASWAKVAPAPRHLNSSTSPNNGASVRNAASFLNNSASSRRSPSASVGKSSIWP